MSEKEKILEFIRASGIRAFKTFLQTCLAMISTGLAAGGLFDWGHMIYSAAFAAAYSILTSVKTGLPEVEEPVNGDRKAWLKAALIRTVRTFEQTAAGLIITGINAGLDWLQLLETAALAALYSLGTSLITGLPEVNLE